MAYSAIILSITPIAVKSHRDHLCKKLDLSLGPVGRKDAQNEVLDDLYWDGDCGD